MIFFKTLKRIAEENKRPDDELHFGILSIDGSKVDWDHAEDWWNHVDDMEVLSYYMGQRFGDDVYYHVELATTNARE